MNYYNDYDHDDRDVLKEDIDQLETYFLSTFKFLCSEPEIAFFETHFSAMRKSCFRLGRLKTKKELLEKNLNMHFSDVFTCCQTLKNREEVKNNG